MKYIVSFNNSLISTVLGVTIKSASRSRNAQILDQEVKVIAIGMNKELEKTQRINWKKSMESGYNRKAIERPSKR